MNEHTWRSLTTEELLRAVDRSHPEVRELARRLEAAREMAMTKHIEATLTEGEGGSPLSVFMTETQLAERLAISPGTLQMWRVYGGGPAFFKLWAAVRYRWADVENAFPREDGLARKNTTERNIQESF